MVMGETGAKLDKGGVKIKRTGRSLSMIVCKSVCVSSPVNHHGLYLG